ncbi:DUF4276 family protein [Promicromonospora umidemergens]|uniref:DUF4276 family protein n=1 Tax=Promicromonospora umidemergens TaxID=629679 RepID=A0ABP8WGW9_9MICO|nr:DUF4276 family protein [Promicromonospora umidemergens]
MSVSLTFFFLCEGTSDEALVEHLETLILREGVSEALGIPRSGSAPVLEKLKALRDEDNTFDFVLVHRDADGRDPSPRIAEIQSALKESGLPGCPVVPVQMTEAWLLVDEQAIRDAVGRPSGREPMSLPNLNGIERTHDPKAVLKAALLAATGTSGRKHRRAVTQWSTNRRILLQRLDVDGPVRQLESWQRLEQDLSVAVRELMAGQTSP